MVPESGCQTPHTTQMVLFISSVLGNYMRKNRPELLGLTKMAAVESQVPPLSQ
jgi:hypothetical protein